MNSNTQNRLANEYEYEIANLRAINAELLRLCIKALNRSARVHPGFADELRDAITKAQK